MIIVWLSRQTWRFAGPRPDRRFAAGAENALPLFLPGHPASLRRSLGYVDDSSSIPFAAISGYRGGFEPAFCSSAQRRAGIQFSKQIEEELDPSLRRDDDLFSGSYSTSLAPQAQSALELVEGAPARTDLPSRFKCPALVARSSAARVCRFYPQLISHCGTKRIFRIAHHGFDRAFRRAADRSAVGRESVCSVSGSGVTGLARGCQPEFLHAANARNRIR